MNKPFYDIKNPFLRFLRSTKPGIFFSGWLFQGFLYMNKFEKLYKIVLEGFFALIFLVLFFIVSDGPFRKLFFVYAFLAAHTLTWLLNGQFLTIFFHSGFFPYNPRRFLKYTDNLRLRIMSKPYIQAAAVYGSLCKLEYRKTSDLDLRIAMKPGLLNRFFICHFAFLERSRAFFGLFPMDIFVFDFLELTNRMNPQEIPIILYDPQGIIIDEFPSALFYNEFRKHFVSKFM